MKKQQPRERNDNMMLNDETKRPGDVSVSLYGADRPISLEGKNFVPPNYYKVNSVSQNGSQVKKKSNEDDDDEEEDSDWWSDAYIRGKYGESFR